LRGLLLREGRGGEGRGGRRKEGEEAFLVMWPEEAFCLKSAPAVE